MKADERERIVRFFETRLAEHGADPRSLAFSSRESQYARFPALADIAQANAGSVLEVGSGFGDFADYLRDERGWAGPYTGYDLTPGVVEAARRLRPHLAFEVRDVLRDPGEARFDYVFGSGILAYFPGMSEAARLETARAMLRALWGLCRQGMAANFLTAYTPGTKHPESWYAQPEDILRFCFSLTTRVTLRHDYRANDFTVYCYHDA